MLHHSIARRRLDRAVLAPLAAILLAGSAPAFALEADGFAAVLKSTLSNQGADLTFNAARVDGSNVVLEGASIGLADVPDPTMRAFFDVLTFENVSETDGGGYRAERLGARDVTGELPPMKAGEGQPDRAATYRIGEWAMEGIQLPGPNATGQLAELSSAGLFYDRAFINDAEIKVEDQTFVTLESAESVNDYASNPVSFDATIDAATIDLSVPPDPEGQMTAWIDGTGYRQLTMDAVTKGSWELDSGTIELPEATITLRDMGSLNMEMAFAGYTPALAKQIQEASQGANSGDAQAQQAAGMQIMGLMSQLQFGRLILGYQDSGMADTLLDYYAKENGQTKEELVQQTLAILPLMLGQLQAPELQSQVQDAVTAFLNDPQSITISLKPDANVPVMALVGAAMSSPGALAQALNAQVTANQ